MAIVIDTETTGLNPHIDRVVELAILNFYTGEQLFHMRFNPECPIPPEVSKIHGITDEDVRDAPKFSSFASIIATWIENTEAVIGYNVMFDRNMIVGEFKRIQEFAMPRWPTLVCAKRLWDMHEPKRNQMAAYKRFVDRKGFSEAHSALGDVQACRHIVANQLADFSLLGKPWEELDPEQKSWYGPTEHLIWNDSILHVNFGKNKGIPVHKVETSFWRWLCDKDFPEHVKRIGDWMMHCADYSKPEVTLLRLTLWARKEEEKL